MCEKSPVENRNQRLINNTVLLGIGTIFNKCITLIMVVLYSRWLSAEAYGDFELYLTYVSLLVPVATLSCGEALFRFLLDRDGVQEKRSIISTAFGISFFGFIVSVVLLFLLAKKLFTSYFVEFIILFALEALFSLLQYLARGIRKLNYYTIASIINAVVMAVGTTLFVCIMNMGLKGLMYGYICGYAGAVIFCLSTMKVFKFFDYTEIRKKEAEHIIKYSIPLIPNSIAWWIANALDRTIVTAYLGSGYNGIYSIANKIPGICVMLFSVFHLSWQESTSDAIREDGDAGKYFSQVFNKFLLTVFSIAIVVLSTNFLFFQYIFDSKYIAGYEHVAILTSAIIFSFTAQYIGGIFIGLKNTSVNGITTMLAALVNIIFNLLLIKSIGLYAASISTLISFAFLLIVRLIIIRKKYKLNINKKVIGYTILYGYFVLTQYINIMEINYINLIIAGIVFLYTNKEYAKIILKKVL